MQIARGTGDLLNPSESQFPSSAKWSHFGKSSHKDISQGRSRIEILECAWYVEAAQRMLVPFVAEEAGAWDSCALQLDHLILDSKGRKAQGARPGPKRKREK